MSTADPKAAPSPSSSMHVREKGVKVFTYPKIFFIFPTFVASTICWIGMTISGSQTERPATPPPPTGTEAPKPNANDEARAIAEGKLPYKHLVNFRTTQNKLGMLFLLVFAFNLLILTLEFPRFTVVAGLLLGTTITFFLLWLATVFDFLTPLVNLIEGIYVVANAQFYFVFTLILSLMYVVIFISRWLDYWEIMPNEILHHHGPLSDLERYPTMNLKFDKEIPDIFEHFMFGSGRLVLRVQEERKSIILDNVLRINHKEEALKKLMSRLEVRVTTDQEVAG